MTCACKRPYKEPTRAQIARYIEWLKHELIVHDAVIENQQASIKQMFVELRKSKDTEQSK